MNEFVRRIPVDASFAADPRRWLAAQASDGVPWLLAHADDGVIWGCWEPDGKLVLSGDVFHDPTRYPAIAIPLRAETLQQARLFGPAGELLVWRTANGFAARLIEDGPRPPANALPDQINLLWGRDVRNAEARDGFVLLEEGQQGLRHAPPLTPPLQRRPALVVRHYVEYDDQGQAYICLSRLVDLKD